MSFNLKSAIGAIAPTLAAMLGGPLAGAAVGALTNAFGLKATGDQNSDLDQITKVVQDGKMTPEMIASVRAADQKHAEIIGQQGIDLQKLNAAHEESLASTEAADRASARHREEVIKDATPARLAYLIIVGFFVIAITEIIGMTIYPEKVALISQPAWLLIGTIFGYLANESKQAAAYYFGDTAGNKSKDATIDKALNSPD